MWRQFYAGMDVKLPLFAMGVFIAFFVLLLLRTYAYKRSQDFDGVAALPLADDSLPPSNRRSAAP